MTSVRSCAFVALFHDQPPKNVLNVKPYLPTYLGSSVTNVVKSKSYFNNDRISLGLEKKWRSAPKLKNKKKQTFCQFHFLLGLASPIVMTVPFRQLIKNLPSSCSLIPEINAAKRFLSALVV